MKIESIKETEFVKTTTMKVELIKETNFAGEVTYFVTLDGSYVSGSMSGDAEKADKMYQFILESRGEKKTEIIKQTEI